MTKKKTETAEPATEPMYSERELADAEREAFKHGWEAAKLEAFKTLAQAHLQGKAIGFYICSKVARHVLPLVEERLKDLVTAPDAKHAGTWSVAIGQDFDPFADDK